MFPDLLKASSGASHTALLPFSSSPAEFLLRSQEIVFVGARYKHSRVHKGYASTDRPLGQDKCRMLVIISGHTQQTNARRQGHVGCYTTFLLNECSQCSEETRLTLRWSRLDLFPLLDNFGADGILLDPRRNVMLGPELDCTKTSRLS